MLTEFPSDLIQIGCPNEDCTWYGEITDLEVMQENSSNLMVCICPVCAETVFEQLDRTVELLPTHNGDDNANIQDQGHPT